MGTAGLPVQISSHQSLLANLQHSVSNFATTQEDCMGHVLLFQRHPVEWNGHPLTSQEYKEIRQAVLSTSITRHGYDCSSCDPLLVTLAATFQLEIIHQLLNDATVVVVYSVRYPCRTVHLESNSYHMVHQRNVDIRDARIQDFASRDKEVGDVGSSTGGDFACKICGCTFTSRKNVNRHEKLKHKALEVHTGPWCDKS